MKYIEFLTNILESLGCTVDGSAVLVPGTDQPVKVKVTDKSGVTKEHELVLPTHDRLSENDWSEVIAFHPVSENVTCGESDILKFLTRYVRVAVIENTFVMANAYLTLLASKDKKRSTYAKYLSNFQGLDANSKVELDKFLAHLRTTGLAPKLCGIAFERNGRIEGKSTEPYSRLLNFYVPMLEDNDDDASLMGHRFRSKTQRKAIRQLILDLMLGGSLQVGSNGEVPYFEALMEFWTTYADYWNKLAKGIEKDTELKLIDVSFKEHMDKILTYRKRIVALPGNTGESLLKTQPTDNRPDFDADKIRREDTKAINSEPSTPQEPNGFFAFRDGAAAEPSPRNTTTRNPLEPRYGSFGSRRGYGDRDRDNRGYSDHDRAYSDRDRGYSDNRGYGLRDRDDNRGYSDRQSGYGFGSRRDNGYSREDRSRMSKFGR